MKNRTNHTLHMNRKLLFLLSLFLLTALTTKSQFLENFNDSNFTENPVWTGSDGSWIINSANQLQSNNMENNSVFYLSTASTLATTAQWEFYVNLKFATSGANYTDVYLTASESNITAITTTGYFVRIGNTTDEISLYRKDPGVAAVTKIIDGIDGSVNSSANNKIKIKVIRDAANQWTLLQDMTGVGNTYFNEGSATDATYTTAAYFGIIVKQSSAASFGQKHFFDDIEVKPYAPDVTAPVIKSATALTNTTLDVLFDEPLNNFTARVPSNYEVNNSIGSPTIATQDTLNNALVHLTFLNSFPGSIPCTLTVNNVQDIAGNTSADLMIDFSYSAPHVAQQYDVVIDEIMTDPTPQVALPDNEWIELKNTAGIAINLEGWKINGPSAISGEMPAFNLLPDSFVTVCSGNAVAAMAVFGRAIGVTGFPSFSNDAGQVALLSPQGKTIHAIDYSASWYQNELKKNGGWTLEMIDTKNPCSGISNWKGSTDPRGGSPGSKNAVDAINADVTAPELVKANVRDSLNITATFDEPLDSFTAAAITSYTISDGIGAPVNAVAVPPFFNQVNLKLRTPLLASKIYTISVTGVTDCTGNVIASKRTARLGISAVADSLDIVINEILYNPPSGGSDYIELYNRSNKIIDLHQTYIANRGSNNNISSITAISADSYLLFPQDFVLLTNDIAFVKASYITLNPDNFIAIKLPVYNNDKGSVIILNAQGNITDEVSYNDSWQFKLLANTEGVSLERIDYNGPSQMAGNWHSAATSAGYGTPAYKNSQYNISGELPGYITITPAIVSPDNDGQDDFATINYNFPTPGFVANITIFDAAGRPVRFLQRNALCGITGNFRWDGLGEKSQPLATGVYIIYTEIFNLEGKIRKFKSPVVVAKRH